MGSSVPVTSKQRFSRWLGLTMLFLGAALLITWWIPSRTKVHFYLANAPQMEGDRRSLEVALSEPGWLWAKVWRQPDSNPDGCLVYMSCGSQEWKIRASTIPGVAANRGAVRFAGGGLLNFSLPDEAECKTVEVSWVNPPREWLGQACALLMLAGLLWILPQCGAVQQWAIAVSACAIATGLSARLITDAPVTADASQNFEMALNLLNHGTYSVGSSMPVEPTNYREPLPNFVATTAIIAGRWIHGDAASPEIRQARDLIAAKSSNLILVFVGLFATWSLAWAMSRQHPLGLVSAYLAWIVFYANPTNVDSLLSETHAAALLAGASAALIRTVDRRSWRWSVIAGSLIGLLCLTKASFLYIATVLFAGVAVFAVFSLALRIRRVDSARILWLVAASACSAALVCIPWMARNKFHFGNWSITQRGGAVLMIRATKNQMTHAEWIASWWLWGPSVYRIAVAGGPLSARAEDFELGGTYERLSRSANTKAVSFYHLAKDERTRAVSRLQSAGHPHPLNAADRELQPKAIAMVLSDLPAHLKCSLPFAWRGVWCASLASPFCPRLPALLQAGGSTLLSAALWVSLWGVALVAVWRRSPRLMMAIALSAGMLAMHALLTHNIPRYSAPAIPVMCVCLAAALWWSGRALGKAANILRAPPHSPTVSLSQASKSADLSGKVNSNA